MAVTPLLSEYDLYLLNQGQHLQSYDKLGAHLTSLNGIAGVHFAVWAPNAEYVAVVGDFNDWEEGMHPLNGSDSGVWSGFVPGAVVGDRYKFYISAQKSAFRVYKADPYAFASEIRPQSASLVYDLSGYVWNDSRWMNERRARQSLTAPQSIYEVHLGSWRRVPEDNQRWLTYREIAPELAAYAQQMGFTHVELLPITEHPLDGSWGYQTVGYFSPTSRFGSPHDFMFFVDTLHQAGIGVMLDWVPAHFPKDEHGLALFDGTHLYEHADPRQGVHREWGTYAFNFGRTEVNNFLLSSALFWLEKYHIDGLRVDAVASMLYLDYSRDEGEWLPNAFGGRENLEAVDFVKRLNTVIYEKFPDAITVAEESTAWPMVSRPTYLGGLGFGFKWNMGWMHDSLAYFSKDPVHRAFHHNSLTFGLLYAFHENFVLPFSHDEVVHGKGSMIAKMSGDNWQRMANLRSLYGFMFGHPGKKLLFMGCEFGQWDEWSHDKSLDWHLLSDPAHRGLQLWVKDLNTLLRKESALHENDFDPSGFQWIDCNDSAQSVLSFVRFATDPADFLVCVCNLTPVVRNNYRLGAPQGGVWREVLNSDSEHYGGSGVGNLGALVTVAEPLHGFDHSFVMELPPLAVLFLKPSL